MSHVNPGPLASYESLADPNLTGYFNNSRMRRHLRKSGLINKKGDIVSEKVFRLNNARKDHQRHIRDVLAQAIIHKALDMERHRQMSIKQQLESIAKVERVRRVRAERALRGDEDILPLLSPRSKSASKKRKKQKYSGVPILKTVTDGEEVEQYPANVAYPAIPDNTPHNTRTDRMKTPYPNVEIDNQHLYGLDRDALRSFTLNLSEFDLGSGVSPYNGPPLTRKKEMKVSKKKKRPATASGALDRPRTPKTNARSLQLHRKEPPMLHHTQLHTLCRVTFKYLGKMVHLDREEEDPRDTIEVMQQHCGGENLCVFKGQLMPGDNFIIISRRHRTFPFSLSFYLNGVQVERLSTCCEYKHKVGYKLGARTSHFGLVKVEGSQPCFKCMVTKGKLKTRPDPTPPSSAHEIKPKRRSKKREKLKDYDEDNSVEEESDIHHDAGKDETSDSSSAISSESESTISSVSETEDEDGGGNDSSYSDDKYSIASEKNEQYSTASSKSNKNGDESDSSVDTLKNEEVEKLQEDAIETSSSSSKSLENENKSEVESSTSSKQTKIENIDEAEGRNAETEQDDIYKKESSFSSGSSKSASSTSSESSSDSENDATKPKHVSIIPDIKNKSTIDLSSMLLTSVQCDEFYSYMMRHPSSLNVETLILKDCRLGDAKISQILKSFIGTKCLKALDLSGNNLSYSSCYTILDICLGNPIEVLKLDNNPLHDQGIEVLMSGLNKTQRSINTQGLEKKAAHYLISSVIRESKKELGSEIDSTATSEKSSATSSVFHESISLTKLTIGEVGVTKSGLDCVVDFIKLNPRLSFLSVSGNLIGSKSFTDLGCGIKVNNQLKNLELNRCNLADGDLLELLNNLKGRLTTINLSLKENIITDDGANQLLEFVQSSNELGKIILSPGNNITPKLLHKIKKAIKTKSM